MAEAKYCEDCKRIVGIGCNCDDSFKDKVKGVNMCHVQWGPGANGK